VVRREWGGAEDVEDVEEVEEVEEVVEVVEVVRRGFGGVRGCVCGRVVCNIAG